MKNINTIKSQFEYYKLLGDRTFNQLSESDLFWQFNSESNSIGVIVKHLHGNMLSRWTDFLTSDGEKPWRNRDDEFEATISSQAELISKWEEGWACIFDALDAVNETNQDTLVYIRNQGHTIEEAFIRQLAHYSSHIGQIIYIGRMRAADKWESLSIPRGDSLKYNEMKFSELKRKEHFTEEFLKSKK